MNQPHHTPSQTTRIIISGLILEEQTELTLEELCRACAVDTGSISALVDEGVLQPGGNVATGWVFTGLHLRRARTATRLQRDLGVNLAGAALALDLLDELERLRAQLHAVARPG